MDYKINVNRLKENENSNIKAFATVVFGESFKVSSIAIMDGKNGLYVQMPRYRTNDTDAEGRSVYRDFCNPITKEFREELYSNILNTYENAEVNELYIGYNSGDKANEPDIDVLVTPYERDGAAIKGLASLFIDGQFVINNVQVLQGNGGTPFVSMPSYSTGKTDPKGHTIYQDICHPVTKEFRQKLYDTVLKQYQQAKKNQEKAIKAEQKKSGKKKTSEAKDKPTRR